MDFPFETTTEVQWWNINNGRCAGSDEELDDLDLIEKLPPDTME